MKIKVLQEDLKAGLAIVSRTVSKRSTLPVLANVLLQTDNGRLQLIATDLEIVTACWIGAKVEEEGAITLPQKTISDLVTSFPSDGVSMVLNTSTLSVELKCGHVTANVKGMDAKEFPLLPSFDAPDDAIEVDTKLFAKVAEQAIKSTAKDDTRPILTGVSTTFSDGRLHMASTDGFRLSLTETTMVASDSDVNAIVPTKALAEFVRIASAEKMKVWFPENRYQMVMAAGSKVVVTQLLDGNYPDYSPIVPTSHSTRAVVGVSALKRACKTAKVFARDSSKTAMLNIDDGMITVAAQSSETGDNQSQVEATVDGESIRISFNVEYIIDVLDVSAPSPQIAIETTSPMEPGVFCPVGQEGFKVILMPMHMQG